MGPPATVSAAMTDLVTDDQSRRHRGDEPRSRSCLRCGTAFESAWSGERVCKRCKSTSTWRALGARPTRTALGH